MSTPDGTFLFHTVVKNYFLEFDIDTVYAEHYSALFLHSTAGELAMLNIE